MQRVTAVDVFDRSSASPASRFSARFSAGLRPFAGIAAVACAILLGACAGPDTDTKAAAAGATSAPLAAQAGTGTVAWQRVHLGSGTGAYDFPVYANHALTADMSRIREVIFVQHGIQRNGDDYFAEAARLLAASGRDAAEVLLVAPNFPGTPDVDKGFTGMPVWSVQGWIGGYEAAQGTPVSALQVFDDLIGYVLQKARFPAVKRITVAGHSGGGQIVHRYAVLNNIDERVRASGIDLRYVVANPSSYLYFTPERPGPRGFERYDTVRCPDYDKYRYGMRDLPAYARGAHGMQLFRRYAQRNVTYMVGSDDNDPNHRVLDKACGAEAEGPTRLTRARSYYRYERFLAGERARITHQQFEVVGVGHNQSRMFGSQCGAQALFGTNPSANKSGAACRAPQS
jgi:pimeloyl-ACP methyl ester carboxylesterase